MNLSAYDDTSPVINRKATWINIKFRQLISREIKYRKYVTIGKRFNKETGDYDYFIILLDSYPEHRSCHIAKQDDYGRIKINLSTIWDECGLNICKKDMNIQIECVEHSDDGDIYKLNI